MFEELRKLFPVICNALDKLFGIFGSSSFSSKTEKGQRFLPLHGGEKNDDEFHLARRKGFLSFRNFPLVRLFQKKKVLITPPPESEKEFSITIGDSDETKLKMPLTVKEHEYILADDNIPSDDNVIDAKFVKSRKRFWSWPKSIFSKVKFTCSWFWAKISRCCRRDKSVSSKYEKKHTRKFHVHYLLGFVLFTLFTSLLFFFYKKNWQLVAIIPLGIIIINRAYKVARIEAKHNMLKILGFVWRDFCRESFSMVLYVTWLSVWYFGKGFLP